MPTQEAIHSENGYEYESTTHYAYIHTHGTRDDDSTCAQVRTDRDVVWCAYDTGR